MNSKQLKYVDGTIPFWTKLDSSWPRSIFSGPCWFLQRASNWNTFLYRTPPEAASGCLCRYLYQKRNTLFLPFSYCYATRCVKSARIRCRIFPHSEWIRGDTRFQSECEKMRTRITPNTYTFYAVTT